MTRPGACDDLRILDLTEQTPAQSGSNEQIFISIAFRNQDATIEEMPERLLSSNNYDQPGILTHAAKNMASQPTTSCPCNELDCTCLKLRIETNRRTGQTPPMFVTRTSSDTFVPGGCRYPVHYPYAFC